MKMGKVSFAVGLMVLACAHLAFAQGLSDTDPCDRTPLVLTDGSGFITSPNYPSRYSNNLDCSWRIEVPVGKRVSLHFVAFTVETGNFCVWDQLSIYDGASPDFGPRIGNKLCGSSLPADITSTGNSLYLEFTTDSSVTKTGFRIQYNTIDTSTTTEVPSGAGVTSANCDFENGLCSWTQDRSDVFDWTIRSGSTPSINTGPTSDNTPSAAAHNYAYIETSDPRVEGESARLVSPRFSAVTSSGRCMRFYYHMYGGGMGHLRVYKRLTNGKDELIWHRDGNQGSFWRAAHIDLSGDEQFHLILEGAVGVDFRGDAAIDDIRFEEASCLAVPLDCGQNNEDRVTRIQGGEESSPGQWPWQVQIRITVPGTNFVSQCGGTIISDQWVVSAAHCIEDEQRNLRITDPNALRIYFGEIDVSNYEASEFAQTPELIIPHPYRNVFDVGPNDIVLIKLQAPLSMSEHVNAACLPSPSDNLDPGAQCIVSGWGYNEQGRVTDQLMHVNQEIFDLNDCSLEYGSATVQEDMLCAGSGLAMHSACQGDSGGPLVCQQTGGQYVLAGAVSFGTPCRIASEGLVVYASVEYHLSWIESVIQAN